MSKTVPEIITDKIIEKLEAGIVPWRQPWQGKPAINYVSGKEYSGINRLLLEGGEYLTFKQIQELGGKIKKGSKSHIVVFIKPQEIKQDKKTKETIVENFVRRYYRVFSINDIEGIETKQAEPRIIEHEPIEQAETIIKSYDLEVQEITNSNRAYYNALEDNIRIPHRKHFEHIEEFYNTAFHEIGHSTGHETRLNREEVTGLCKFGSNKYSKEELTAEMTAAFLCDFCGFLPETFDNSAAYIQNWLNALKNDKTLILHASAKAQKALNYVLESVEKNKSKLEEKITEFKTNKKGQADLLDFIKNQPETPSFKPEIKPEVIEKPKKVNLKAAKSLEAKAESLNAKIEKKLNCFSNCNMTRRRANFRESARIDAENLKKVQSILFNLAKLHRSGEIKKEVENINAVSQVEILLCEHVKYKTPEDIEPDYGEWAKEEILKRFKMFNKLNIHSQDDLNKTRTILKSLIVEESQEEKTKRELQKLEDNLIGLKIPGFFPTPEEIIKDMIDYAEIKENDSILEPSAGKGDIAQLIKEETGIKADCIEINPNLQNILNKKGFETVESNFLEFNGKYDKIIMNPPFEKGQDVEHVKHAYSLLKEGGKLVSIMSNAITFRTDKKYADFREWVSNIGGYIEELPENAFKKAFNSTGVRTCLVVLEN
ncbi:antirestriction protein ArdC/predicted RNA methylase [Methanococcus maripaludis]|uniref:Antirestriction protein ArdC/predicted RNA methylase n=1 Tax=Methanococcus maripaludis TaxID=39152 RepID=A0A7J9NTE6_METMI|nr:zincin-like metallopeptidase domain-containing protein [Methanococcus maripaludis]MBA2846502.1 antirestriction protein ArdC/predicted RNA methylase [Methanococcus maripaludis]MBA2850938.1 antirestriction protein ArdC/predicted RNA methylase [Methanococcus maripaludis]